MSSDTDALLELVASGDRTATQSLLARHRERLKRMVDVYLDRRVRGRVDPSDVVQDALTNAHRRLPKYLETRPIAFYPWLRQIAWEQLEKTHRRHLKAQRRSVTREEPWELKLPNDSVYELANRLIATGTSPSRYVEQAELRRRAREALDDLPDRDREVLIFRYLEQLSMREIADLTASTEPAVKMRHLRALERLKKRMEKA
jgi:RNA polymerase sigma-70 factor (ECF subfamily)